MSVYDFFAGRLRCSECGHVSAADSTTNMQTKIRSNPAHAELKVGDPLLLLLHLIEGEEYCGYETVRMPSAGEAIRILESWDCPSCDASPNWAEITVENGVITGIEAVPFDRRHFDRCNLLSEEAMTELQRITDRPFLELASQRLGTLFRQYL